MKGIKLRPYHARVGMKLFKEVRNNKGTILLGKDVTLTTKAITRLCMTDIDFIYVYDDEQEIDKDIEAELYAEKVKSTPEFKKFNKVHTQSVALLQESFNTMLSEHSDIDVNQIMQSVNELLKVSKNGIQVFEMLHFIRDYDDSTYVHSVNVSLICNVMGRWLGLSIKEIELITICGLLHDVGKLMMPQEIVKKKGKLTEDEFRTIQKHPQLGYQLLKDETLHPAVKSAILQHHEKCDGTGYPQGLIGANINWCSKIVTIADIYDAMTADRVYRRGLCPFRVIEMFEKDGFQKYETEYLLKFLANIVDSYIGRHVELSNKEIGKIIYINRQALSKPCIQTDNKYIDLSVENSLYIERLL